MPIDMTALAREGARVRLEQIKAEEEELRRVFPKLTNGDAERAAGWNDAKRQAVSERMKAYWAQRRAAAEVKKRN
jgi:hypothetical protein